VGGRLLVLSLALFAVLGASSAQARVLMARGGDWIQLDAAPPPAHEILRVRAGDVTVRSRPFGPIVERVGSMTEFGSPRAFGVVTRRGGWLGVTDATLGNGRLGWIDAHAGGVSYSRTQLEIDVDLSSRTLVLRRGDVAILRTSVGVGRPGSPTPTGRFAVTDKLNGPSYSQYYGCCILALSATQTNLPRGWSGGNRIAIHGTLSASDFGHAVSAGCVHAPDVTLRYLMRSVPLGTPVFIHA
jgi:L,D-transpeptidase catalytic domain